MPTIEVFNSRTGTWNPRPNGTAACEAVADERNWDALETLQRTVDAANAHVGKIMYRLSN